MNYMSKVAEMLGVELEKEFYIKGEKGFFLVNRKRP